MTTLAAPRMLIARHGCFVRSVEVPAAVQPATTFWSIQIYWDMTKLPRRIVSASVETAVNHHSASQSATHADIQEVSHMGVPRLAMEDFSQSCTTRGVVNDDRQLRRIFQALNDRKVSPGQDH